MKLILVLHNIRSTYNVGAILRTAEGLGVTEVVLSGYTPKYNDSNLLPHLREKLNHQIEKSALDAEKLVKQTTVEDLPEWLAEQKLQGFVVVGLENNLKPEEESQKIMLGKQRLKLGEKVALILGEEVNGIPTDVRQGCDFFLEIPMKGQKESFNVSVAAGIALWGLLQASI